MKLSKVRLDPPRGTFNLRGYKVSGDPDTLLSEEMRDYCVVGSITIAGHIAIGTLLSGDLSDPDLWIDLDDALREKGVTELCWERHKDGEVLIKRRRIKI